MASNSNSLYYSLGSINKCSNRPFNDTHPYISLGKARPDITFHLVNRVDNLIPSSHGPRSNSSCDNIICELADYIIL
jgi:hypothetical protein